MGKLKLKKAGKVLSRAGRGVVGAARGVRRVAEAIVIVAGVVEELRAARRRPGPPGREEPPRRDPGA
jgi:hypothetical protein